MNNNYTKCQLFNINYLLSCLKWLFDFTSKNIRNEISYEFNYVCTHKPYYKISNIKKTKELQLKKQVIQHLTKNEQLFI